MGNGIPGSELPVVNSVQGSDYILGLVDEGNGLRTRRIPKSIFNVGEQGPPGDTGPAGPQGPQGAQGEPGQLITPEGGAFESMEEYDVGAISSMTGGQGWRGAGVAGGASIAERTMRGGEVQKRLVLGAGSNAFYARKFDWGDDWNHMAFGFLVRLNGPAANIPSNTIAMSYGIISGQNDTLASAGGPLNMVGISPNDIPMTFSAGTFISSQGQVSGSRFFTQAGLVRTDRTSGSGTDGRTWALSEAGLSWLYGEILRSPATDGATVTYSVGFRLTAATRIEYSVSKNGLFSGLFVPVSTFLGNFAYQIQGNPVTANFNWVGHQSAGPLDSFHIYNNTPGYDMEIAALYARKVF